MKFLKFLFVAFIFIGAVGYGVYHYGTNFVSEKIADTVNAEFENDENLEEIKLVVNSNPEIKDYIEEGASVDENELPFTTMEEASKTIVKKVGLLELQKIHATYQDGISPHEMQVLVKEMEDKLTEEEILAIKAIAYKHLNN